MNQFFFSCFASLSGWKKRESASFLKAEEDEITEKQQNSLQKLLTKVTNYLWKLRFEQVELIVWRLLEWCLQNFHKLFKNFLVKTFSIPTNILFQDAREFFFSFCLFNDISEWKLLPCIKFPLQNRRDKIVRSNFHDWNLREFKRKIKISREIKKNFDISMRFLVNFLVILKFLWNFHAKPTLFFSIFTTIKLPQDSQTFPTNKLPVTNRRF